MSAEGGAVGPLRVASESVTLVDAKAIVLGYCRHTVRLKPKVPPRLAVGDPLGELTVGEHAYRTYDCVEGGPVYELTDVDVLVANGLNARMRAGEIAGALAVADQVSELLKQLHTSDVIFWELRQRQVCHQPGLGDPAWPMWRAWSILMEVPGLDVARAHKILHHKRPTTFPLIDNKTLPRLGRHAWAAISVQSCRQPPADVPWWHAAHCRLHLCGPGAGGVVQEARRAPL